MKVRIALASLTVASLGVSAAAAAPPPGKGPQPTGPNCRPMVSVILKGTLVGTPGPSATSISVNVTHGNRWARAYVAATQPTSVAVTPTTKVRRQGQKTLGDLQDKDRVLVQARVCKADLANLAPNATPPPLTAVRIVAHPVKT